MLKASKGGQQARQRSSVAMQVGSTRVTMRSMPGATQWFGAARRQARRARWPGCMHTSPQLTDAPHTLGAPFNRSAAIGTMPDARKSWRALGQRLRKSASGGCTVLPTPAAPSVSSICMRGGRGASCQIKES